jgi:hypothetical protein
LTDDNSLDVLWWETDRSPDVLESAKCDFDTLRSHSDRMDRFSTYDRIYRNENIMESLALQAELASFGMELSAYTRANYNLIATVTDNIVSRIVRTKPRAVYQTDGANWSLRQTAKMQQKWVDYVAHAKFFNKHARTQVRDGVLKGIGHTKIAPRYGVDDIGVWYIDPCDVFYDQTEAAYGDVTRLFHRQFCNKDSAKKLFSNFAKEIEQSGVMSESDWHNRSTTARPPIVTQVEIVEGWHLPTYPGAGDGRHVIFCEYGLIVDEPWDREDFPITSFRWKSRPGDSFQGLSVPEEILSIHLDMNFTLQQIHETAELTANPIWLNPTSANVSRDELTDLPGMEVAYSGPTPPQIIQPPKVAFDMVRFLESQEARAYRRLGLDSATPNDPSPGLETGRAVRMDFDARSMAFTSALQNWGELYKDFGDKAVAAGKQIWQRNKSFSVTVPRNKWTVQDVPWDKVALDPRKHSFTIKVVEGSQLSQHPAGRIDDVANMVNMGAVTDIAEMRALLDISDIEHSDSLATSAQDAIEWMCEEMLDDGTPHSPEPYDDLDLCLKLANTYYLRARTQGAPEDRLQLMRNFLDRTTALIQKRDLARAAQMQGMVASGSTPPAPDDTGANPAAIQGT